MTTADESAYFFISTLQKILELYEEEGEKAVLIEDVRRLLQHFEVNKRAQRSTPCEAATKSAIRQNPEENASTCRQ